MKFKLFNMTPGLLLKLQDWLAACPAIFSYNNDDYSSLLICYVLTREIGSPNDDLARFIYDIDQKKKIERSQLRAEIGVHQDYSGYVVRVTHAEKNKLLVTLPDLRALLTCHENEIIISPHAIAAYVRTQDVTPVLVRDWIQQVFFSDFDVQKQKLTEQLWVLRNNDIYLYAKAVANHQVIFQGTHDVVGHIAGLNRAGFYFAANIAQQIFKKLHQYFGQSGRGNFPSHLLPFLIGLLLDDITQKPFYGCEQRADAIKELLLSLDDFNIDPHALLMLKAFPEELNEILQMVRDKNRYSKTLLKTETKKFFSRCYSLISTQIF